MNAGKRTASLSRAIAMALMAVIGSHAPGLTAAAGDTGSRILDSPSRSTVYRGEAVPRSIRPGDRAVSRSLSGRIGDLEAAGPLDRRTPRRDALRTYDCVLHHERLGRTTRQPFSTHCDPTVDIAPGHPAFTTR